MTEQYISAEFVIGGLSGTQHASEIIERDQSEYNPKNRISLTLNCYNSQSTEEGEGCLLDVQLSVLNNMKEDHTFNRTEITVILNKPQARALRDQITAFLEYE